MTSKILIEHWRKIAVAVAVIIIVSGIFFFGRNCGYNSGFTSGYNKGQESIKCDEQSHETQPYR